MIEAEKLTKYYGSLKAIDSLSFQVPAGEILGLLGPNGAGKTTTVKILTCFLAPTSGDATIDGANIFKDPITVRKKIGYLPENAPLYPEMIVLDYLTFIAELRDVPKSQHQKKIKEITEVCGLQEIIGREIRSLSKGYRQRVGLAQAMIHDPKLLILDEPTSGLDPNQIVEIRELIKRIGKEKTVILSTHNLAEVQVTCNRVLIIHRGKLVADGSPEELGKQKGEDKYYLTLQKNGLSPKEIKEKLNMLPSIKEAKEIPNQEPEAYSFLLYSKEKQDLRAKLFNLCVESKWTLLELKREQIQLEEIFRELTQE